MQDSNTERIQDLCVRYIDDTVDREWSAMDREQ